MVFFYLSSFYHICSPLLFELKTLPAKTERFLLTFSAHAELGREALENSSGIFPWSQPAEEERGEEKGPWLREPGHGAGETHLYARPCQVARRSLDPEPTRGTLSLDIQSKYLHTPPPQTRT